MWKYFLLAGLVVVAACGLVQFIGSVRLRSRLRRATGLGPEDLLRWADENLDAEFTWTRILREEEDRFIAAVIGPLPREVKGTPPYEVLAVAKADGSVSQISKEGHGIGIK